MRNTEFYPCIEMNIFTSYYYFHSVKISKLLLVGYFHNVKITSDCDVTSCIACSIRDLKETFSKTKENVMNRKFNVFGVEYGIYFTCETGFLKIFSHVLRTRGNIKKKLSRS